jgi:RteC protein
MRQRITELLRKLEAAIYASERDMALTHFKVEATATDIIELMLAFHAIGFFQVEGEPATQKWLIEWAEQTFGIPLKNWDQVAVNIRSRKSSNSKFLDELTKSFNDRCERIRHDKQYQRRLRNK